MLDKVARAISSVLPPGVGLVAFLLEPADDRKISLHHLDTMDGDRLRISHILVQWLLGQDPQIILEAFALERRAKIAAELGIPVS
jgi:hypothetical protein